MRIGRTILALSGVTVLTAVIGGAGPAVAAPAGCTPTWQAVETPPNPPGYSKLTNGGVSAVAPDDVWFANSVGENVTPEISAVTRWDGRAIRPMKRQIPQDRVMNPTIYDGSFDSGTSGWVIGIDSVYGLKPGTLPYATRWHDGRWTRTPLAPSPAPSTTSVALYGIASVSPTDAWAVGSAAGAESGAVVQHWDGTRWTATDHPGAQVANAVLLDVTATAADDVWAVGNVGNGSTEDVPLVEHWDGTSWTAVDLPELPPGVALGSLTSVSGSGPDDVWVSGFQGAGQWSGRALPLLGHWDGESWRWVDLPDTGPAVLTGVYTAGPADVWAVVNRPGGDPGELLRWDGEEATLSAWPGRQEYGLHYFANDIDGTGPDDVWAVGSATRSPGSTASEVRQMVAHLSCVER